MVTFYNLKERDNPYSYRENRHFPSLTEKMISIYSAFVTVVVSCAVSAHPSPLSLTNEPIIQRYKRIQRLETISE